MLSRLTVIYFIITLSATLLATTTTTQAADLISTDVFVSGEDGYFAYRIPAIEKTPDGTLLAFAEARKNNLSDPGGKNQDIDLVYKTSTDNGKTWSKMVILEDPGDFWSAANACTLVDRDRLRVWLFYIRCVPNRNCFQARPETSDMTTHARYSDDNGKTWSDAIDVTNIVRDMQDPKWRASVAGPGGGIQTRSGVLMVPFWASTVDRGSNLTMALTSHDHGKTWQRGRFVPLPAGGNENQLVELADGKVLMDIRQNRNQKGHRWQTVSSNDGKTWSEAVPGNQVTPVACAIERYSLAANGKGRNRILWTGPKGPGRNHLVLRISYDEGKTFTEERSISKEPAAYSDMTILKDGSVGVFWERGKYEYMTFTRLDRDFVEGPAGQ